jgi:NTP pyrophosphatase (non-canonical NTP hydrolase)
MKALDDILAERSKQDKKWGVQNHDPFTWLSILQEEVGEYAKEINEYPNGQLSYTNMRNECVQVAAVALQMVECIDRNEWSWK